MWLVSIAYNYAKVRIKINIADVLEKVFHMHGHKW